MGNKEFLAEIRNIIDQYNLSPPGEEVSLGKNQFTIYLCGESGSGKTAFLNALLDLNKNEFPEGTNVTTKTKFTINFSDKYEYKNGIDEAYLLMPTEFKLRQDILKKLNNSGLSVKVKIPCEFLIKKTIIDIPGFFDHANRNLFMHDLISDADIVFFFKHFKDRISINESALAGEISSNNIPCILLYTYFDTYRPNEGINKSELPKYLQRKADEYGALLRHFSISSAIHFDAPEKSGILLVKEFIEKQQKRINDISQKSKKLRIVNHYSSVFEKLLKERNEQIDNEKTRIIALHEISLSRVKENLANKKEDFNEVLNSKCRALSKNIRSYFDIENKTTEGFKLLWRTEWNSVINFLVEYVKFMGEFILMIPDIPEYNPIIIDKHIDVWSDASDFIDVLSDALEEDKKGKNVFDKIKEDIKEKSNLSKTTMKKLRELLLESEDGKVAPVKNIKVYYEYFTELKNFKCKVDTILSDFESIYSKQFSSVVELQDLKAQYESECSDKLKNLSTSLGIEQLKEDIKAMKNIGKMVNAA
jgi:GTPase SAR1 family protein